MKKSVFIALSLSLISGFAQARGGSQPSMENIYCMGSEIVINYQESTISSSKFGLKDVPVKFKIVTQDNGVEALVGKARGIDLFSIPAESAGWSGDQNTTLTVGTKFVTSECTIN